MDSLTNVFAAYGQMIVNYINKNPGCAFNNDFCSKMQYALWDDQSRVPSGEIKKCHTFLTMLVFDVFDPGLHPDPVRCYLDVINGGFHVSTNTNEDQYHG